MTDAQKITEVVAHETSDIGKHQCNDGNARARADMSVAIIGMLNYGNENTNIVSTDQWLSKNAGSSTILQGKKTLIRNIVNSNALAIADDVAAIAMIVVGGTILYLAARSGNKDGAAGVVEGVTTAVEDVGSKLSELLKIPGYTASKPNTKENILPNVSPAVDNNPVEVYPAEERKAIIETVTPVEVSKPEILMSKTEAEKVAEKILEKFIAKEKRLRKFT